MSIGARSETIVVGDCEVPMQVDGSGPPLLFLHGAAGAGVWSEAHRLLSESFTVYAPVHPGFGGTPLPDWVDGAEDMAFHYVDVVAALGLRRPIVVGVSLGGYIATELAVIRPGLPAGLVLVDALGLRPEHQLPDVFILEPFEAMSLLVHDTSKLAALLPAGGLDVDFIVRQYEDQAAAARLLWQRAYDPKLDRRLHHLTCPTLVMWGARDQLLPPSHGERLAQMLPNARFQLIEGSGHVPTVEEPETFAIAIQNFATTLELGA